MATYCRQWAWDSRFWRIGRSLGRLVHDTRWWPTYRSTRTRCQGASASVSYPRIEWLQHVNYIAASREAANLSVSYPRIEWLQLHGIIRHHTHSASFSILSSDRVAATTSTAAARSSASVNFQYPILGSSGCNLRVMLDAVSAATTTFSILSSDRVAATLRFCQ